MPQLVIVGHSLSRLKPPSTILIDPVAKICYDFAMEILFEQLLDEIGEDKQRQGLRDTPKRAAKALRFLTQGYTQSLPEIINDAIFDSDLDEMVIVKNSELY